MRAFRFGPALALVVVALGGWAAFPGTGVRAQASSPTNEVDRQLDDELASLIASAEIGPDGKVLYTRASGDPEFLEPNSGLYWQVRGEGQEDFRSRSLWDRRLEDSGRQAWTDPLHYDSNQFADEPLRIAERTVRLPGSEVEWQFAVARARNRATN